MITLESIFTADQICLSCFTLDFHTHTHTKKIELIAFANMFCSSNRRASTSNT